jgi:hypothetical protein
VSPALPQLTITNVRAKRNMNSTSAVNAAHQNCFHFGVVIDKQGGRDLFAAGTPNYLFERYVVMLPDLLPLRKSNWNPAQRLINKSAGPLVGTAMISGGVVPHC